MVSLSGPESPPCRAWSALSTATHWKDAVKEVLAARPEPALDHPHLVLVFASPAFAHAFPAMLGAIRDGLGAGIQIGCAASGVMAGDREVEDAPALAIMALWLPGARLFPLRFHHEQADLLGDPETYREIAGVDVGDVTSWLMFAEPFRIDAQLIMRGLSRCYPGVPIMGGMASGMIGDRTSCVFLDHQVYDEGAVAIGFGGPYRLEPSVAHGCDPIGETWTITETERNLLIGISNRPALAVMRSTIAGHQADDPDHVLRNLMIGLAANEYADGFGRGDFLVRGVLAVDEERGAIAVGGMPRVGQTMQFQLRSARVASLDLSRILVDLALSGLDSAVAAILCTCDGRGKALFGEEGHDATMVQAGLPGIPLAGAFCLGEIGPMGAGPGTHSTELHGVTATLGVLRYQPGG